MCLVCRKRMHICESDYILIHRQLPLSSSLRHSGVCLQALKMGNICTVHTGQRISHTLHGHTSLLYVSVCRHIYPLTLLVHWLRTMPVMTSVFLSPPRNVLVSIRCLSGPCRWRHSPSANGYILRNLQEEHGHKALLIKAQV